MEAFDKVSVAIRGLGFVDLDREIKRTMRRSAKDVIQIGYMLKQMRDKKLWEVQYSCLDEYLTQELGIDYTAASRFMNLNSKYSLHGNSMEIAAKYENYSQGLLIEMLSMPPELEEKVNACILRLRGYSLCLSMSHIILELNLHLITDFISTQVERH